MVFFGFNNLVADFLRHFVEELSVMSEVPSTRTLPSLIPKRGTAPVAKALTAETLSRHRRERRGLPSEHRAHCSHPAAGTETFGACRGSWRQVVPIPRLPHHGTMPTKRSHGARLPLPPPVAGKRHACNTQNTNDQYRDNCFLQ